MSRKDFINRKYSVFSIYYDMFNTPLNIDIKKMFKENIIPNIHNTPLFLIRFIKQKDVFPKLYNTIINENGINYHAFTIIPPSVIWNYEKMGFPSCGDLSYHDLINHSIIITNNWCKIIDNNKITIDNIIFITSKYIDVIDEIKANKNIFLITNSKMKDEYNTKNINVINYDKYINNDVEERIKEYNNICNWKDSRDGEPLINPNIFYMLNMLAEAFNYNDLNYTCLKYCLGIKNMKMEEREENIEQYGLFFDYMNN